MQALFERILFKAGLHLIQLELVLAHVRHKIEHTFY